MFLIGCHDKISNFSLDIFGILGMKGLPCDL